MAVSIQVCNFALADIRAPSIATIDDPTPEARECARFYPLCLQSLLEMHDWSFATTTASLALLGTNARSGEWLYAYALPSDFASAVRIVGQSLPISGVYYPWPYTWPRPQGFDADFIIDEGVLYTSQESAVLEYSRAVVSDSVMPALFKKALSLDIASYLATAIRDDSSLKGELIRQAEVAKARAMADDMNRQPQRFGQGFNEVAWARA